MGVEELTKEIERAGKIKRVWCPGNQGGEGSMTRRSWSTEAKWWSVLREREQLALSNIADSSSKVRTKNWPLESQCEITEYFDKQNGKKGTKSEVLGSGVNGKREIEMAAGV